MKDLNLRHEPIRNLEDNKGSNLLDISHNNFFQDTSPKAKETNGKLNFWNFIKIKIFCTAKETVNITRRQPTEWEKIFANESTDKRLISRIYNELLKLNTHKADNHIKNGQSIGTDISLMKTYKWLSDT